MTYTHAMHICNTCVEWISANVPAQVPARDRMNLCFTMACLSGLRYAVAEDIGAWPGEGPMPPLRVFFPPAIVGTFDVILYDDLKG